VVDYTIYSNRDYDLASLNGDPWWENLPKKKRLFSAGAEKKPYSFELQLKASFGRVQKK
jgi:hypothetical protein